MKKLLFAAFFLLTTPAFAGTISIPPFISGNDVTIAALENQRTTLSNVINGNIEGGTNIKAGSLVSPDFANSVSPVVRWNESFSDFTFSGMLPATDASLTSNISAGTSYVDGFRVVVGTTAHTYTASKDTYVYIHSGGYYQFTEVANGASSPSTPVNTLLLAKAVTDGSAITSVSDLRTLSIQITATTSNFPTDFRNGSIVSWDSTTAMHVEPGNIAIGNTIYTRTADTSSKTISTGANWIGGSAPSLTGTKVYMYLYNDSGSSFDFKYSTTAPTESDLDGNTGGPLRYLETGGVNYRNVGWFYASADAVQNYSFGNFDEYGINNRITRSTRAYAALGAASTPAIDDTIPQQNEGRAIDLDIPFAVTNQNKKIKISGILNLSASGAGTAATLSLFRDSGLDAISTVVLSGGLADSNLGILPFSFEVGPPGSLNTFLYKLRVGNSGGQSFFLNGTSNGAARFYGGALNSYWTIEEVT